MKTFDNNRIWIIPQMTIIIVITASLYLYNRFLLNPNYYWHKKKFHTEYNDDTMDTIYNIVSNE